LALDFNVGHFEDKGVDGGDNIKMNLQRMNWIYLAQDRYRFQAVQTAVIKCLGTRNTWN